VDFTTKRVQIVNKWSQSENIQIKVSTKNIVDLKKDSTAISYIVVLGCFCEYQKAVDLSMFPLKHVLTKYKH